MIKTASGGDILLSKYHGKALGVAFILTTCSHCQNTSKILTKMHQEFGSQGFMPVGIAINEMAHMLISDFVRNFGVSFPVGWQVRDNVLGFLQKGVMEQMYMPNLVFIDKEGVIRAQFGGEEPFFDEVKQEANIRAQIKSLLLPAAKKAAAGAAKK